MKAADRYKQLSTWETYEMPTKYWSEILKERYHLEDGKVEIPLFNESQIPLISFTAAHHHSTLMWPARRFLSAPLRPNSFLFILTQYEYRQMLQRKFVAVDLFSVSVLLSVNMVFL
jgi:hypothetical protein